MTQHVGIIDLGSNTARMIVVQYQPHHSFKLVEEVKENVRLAHNVGSDNQLQAQPIAKAIETLRMFGNFCRAMGVSEVVAVATSAVRDAANQTSFLAQVKEETGLDLRVLSGDEEAYYSYLGMINTLGVSNGFMFDIGGGSVELALVRGRGLAHTASLPLGTVRLTEQILRSDTPSKAELKALDRHVDEALAGLDWFRPQGSKLPLIGVGGTVRNLAKLEQRAQRYPLDIVHGYTMSLQRVDEWATRLSKLNRNEREQLEGLNNDRADVITAGVLLIRALMQRCGADSLWICGHGLRDGIFYEHFLRGSQPPLLSDVRQFSVANLARIYGYNVVHVAKVRELSLSLFDQLQSLHGYGAWERELLEATTMVHDIGVAVNFYDHHKHGLYLILNSMLNGYTHREMALIGLLTRHHRKGGVTDAGLGGVLAEGDLERLGKLSALLRIAEYLERSKSQVVQAVVCKIEKQQVRISVQAVGDASIEIWDANRKTNLFRKAYGVEVVIA
ncbi:exopolyphosphatase [Herpetosiphon llansteffanensis]